MQHTIVKFEKKKLHTGPNAFFYIPKAQDFGEIFLENTRNINQFYFIRIFHFEVINRYER